MKQELDLSIDGSTANTVEESMNKIASELMNKWAFVCNNSKYTFTEIEFYYYNENTHKDISTHPHSLNQGNWRFHNQGLDVTLQGDEKTIDGGILIRGIKKIGSGERADDQTNYINGPRRVIAEIFSSIGDIYNKSISIGIVPREQEENKEIKKTSRHGLPNSIPDEFRNKLYRYYCDLDNWNISHVTNAEKQKIRANSLPI